MNALLKVPRLIIVPVMLSELNHLGDQILLLRSGCTWTNPAEVFIKPPSFDSEE